MERGHFEGPMPPPIPDDAKKKGGKEKTTELQEGDLLPYDEKSAKSDITAELSTGDLLPVTDADADIGEDETGLAKEDDPDITPLAPVPQQDEHVRTLHEDADTQIIGAEPQAEPSSPKYVVIGEKRMSVPNENEPVVIIESNAEAGEGKSLKFEIAEIVTKFSRFKAHELATNPEFLQKVDTLADRVDGDPEVQNQLREFITSISRSKNGEIPTMSESGKATFSQLGSRLFERNPRAFAEKFGTGHQRFTPRLRRIETVTKLALESKKGAAEEVEDLLVNGVILPDEVLGVLHNLEGDEAAKLEKKITDAEVGPLVESRKRLELLKNYEASRDRISLAIAKEMPELSVQDHERFETENELKKKDVRTVPIGTGITAPLFAENASGLSSVYKPALHESGNENGDGTGGPHMRLSLRKDESLYSEVMAGSIALLTGMKRFPETTLVNGPVGIGTKQKWKEGKSASRAFAEWAEPDKIKEQYQLDMEEIAVLDLIINNSDRHLNNILIDMAKGEAIPIDHGLSQVDDEMDPREALADICAEQGLDPATLSPEQEAECLNKIISRIANDQVSSTPIYFLQDKPINPDLMRRLTKLKETIDMGGEVEMALTDQYRLLYGDEKGMRLMKQFRSRLDNLVSTQKFPKPSMLFNLTRKGSLLKRIEKLKANQPGAEASGN